MTNAVSLLRAGAAALASLRARPALRRFLRDRNGATAIEYALIAAGVAVAIVSVVRGVGSSLANSFASVNSNLQ